MLLKIILFFLKSKHHPPVSAALEQAPHSEVLGKNQYRGAYLISYSMSSIVLDNHKRG